QLDGLLAGIEIDMDDRNARPTGGLLVLAGDRMYDRGPQRVLARRPLAAAPDGLFDGDAIEGDVAADDDVIDRDSGILAQQIAGALGDCDILHHGIEDGAAGRVALAPDQLVKACLD